jgi:hypothetical protein
MNRDRSSKTGIDHRKPGSIIENRDRSSKTGIDHRKPGSIIENPVLKHRAGSHLRWLAHPGATRGKPAGAGGLGVHDLLAQSGLQPARACLVVPTSPSAGHSSNCARFAPARGYAA